MLHVLYVVVYFLLFHNASGSHAMDNDLQKMPMYWYNITGFFDKNMTFSCSIKTNSKPSMKWITEKDNFLKYGKEGNWDDDVFSINSCQKCSCKAAIDSRKLENIRFMDYNHLDFIAFRQAAIYFKSSEILHSTCTISRNTYDLLVNWEYNIHEIMTNIISHISGRGNGISIAQMQIQSGSVLNSVIYTCNMSDIILLSNISSGEGLKSDDDSENTINGWSILYIIIVIIVGIVIISGFYTCCQVLCCEPPPQHPTNDPAFLVVVAAHFNGSPSNNQHSGPQPPAVQQPQSVEPPPAYQEIDRSETPPPSFESIYSMEVK